MSDDIVKNMLEAASKAANDVEKDKVVDALYISRQSDMRPLSPWFQHILENYADPMFSTLKNTEETVTLMISQIAAYAHETKIKNYVIGLSGGADSAICYAVFKEVQKQYPEIKIHGYTLPIHQKDAETDLAKELVIHYGDTLKEVDLSQNYDIMANTIMDSSKPDSIRNGNLRARMRMMYLYNVAHELGGIVVSTDNFSEYTAGFWTINGDVGDIAPLRNFFKSIEVPAIGRYLNLPEKFWRVTPTDGLGISKSDEDQLGMTYLEWDIVVTMFIAVTVSHRAISGKLGLEEITYDFVTVSRLITILFSKDVSPTKEDLGKMLKALERIYGSWFKRHGTVDILSPFFDKVGMMEQAEKLAVIPYSVMKLEDFREIKAFENKG